MYLKVRQPPVIEISDVYTIISLLVSNKMLEEACYYRRQNSREFDEEKLILHFLNGKYKLLNKYLFHVELGNFQNAKKRSNLKNL